MVDIERKWFGQTNCLDSSTLVSSNSLGLKSFWGLFLIVGIVSLSAFIIFIIVFVHKHKHVLLRSSDPNASIWGKIVELARHFDNKDLSSHTFRKSEPQEKSGIDIVGSMGAPQASPNVNGPTIPSSFSFHATPNCNCPPSPSTSSNHTNGNFASFEGTHSREYGDPILQRQEHKWWCQTLNLLI
ncbi:Glutamate receptor 2.8 [Camellia lanceoleosa]|uniref:Glutamate receptor 2.8 n=1 Tax=Camellia lanceoleosa TaxID=1840588 RepID=A0ACC0FMI7_9ERIC|nr:Glutamate receptor 2.8 [Camellia lanceoleosa]